MKPIASLSVLVAFAMSGAAFAQSGDMNGMDMKGMEMMKGMNSDGKAQGAANNATVHKATGVVKAVDPSKGNVTLQHGPVNSLNWPAMTMAFAVKDKALFDKLPVGQKVDVEFTQQGPDYVITAVK